MSSVILSTKLVGDISGEFFVPSYQRGYRWDEEVERLLDDIYANGQKGYCLQPIVVKKDGSRYILIDGQQRLTTIYLIYSYLHNKSGEFLDGPKFTLEYATRKKSKEFLAKIDAARREENIDFWYMSNAYEKIDAWFTAKGKRSVWTNINKYFDENIRVIWYEVDANENEHKLFTRLNIGKIPLTNAELVKAMFLSENANKDITEERQNEISLQWDNIERQLRNEGFWYFLTNKTGDEYQTKIDLILNLIAHKPLKSREQYYTFFAFAKMSEERELKDIWQEILHTFLILKDWYESDDLYHKIGYLIAASAKNLSELYDTAKEIKKDKFTGLLDKYIRESIKFDKKYEELEYGRDNPELQRLLLLFNIESIKHQTRFPFDKYKHQKNGVGWSLEHIHARHSRGLKTQAEWREWLKLHLDALVEILGESDALVTETNALLQAAKVERYQFEGLQEKITDALSADGGLNMDYVGNLALLNTSDNAAVNNSTFDVKRKYIIEMDKAGKYIPHCTKMVFLKYYTPSEHNQLHFWGLQDRNAYVAEINKVLKDYMTGAISPEETQEGN